MSYTLPEHLLPVFEKHFATGSALAQAVVVLDDASDTRPRKPGFWARCQAHRAITHLQKCVALLPTHWQAYWLLGKVYQSLCRYPEALTSFEQAAILNPHHLDVLREASIGALDAGNSALAVYYSALALQEAPDDTGLLGNHGINLLVSGQDAAALQLLEKALALTPGDVINQQAYRLIKQVVAGTRPRPTCREIAGR